MEENVSKPLNRGRIRVRRELCFGCGFCVQVCPQGAISFPLGWAEVDQGRCISCRLCLEVCPQGAIVETIAVSKHELKAVVTSLNQKTDDLLARIERLRR